MADDVAILRAILQRELETINAYEEMLGRLSDQRLKEIVQHVTDEEREHVAEMYELIMANDPRQRAQTAPTEDHLRRVFGDSAAVFGDAAAVAGAPPLDEIEAPPAARPAAPAPLETEPGDPFPQPQPVFPSGAWSVGSLKRVK